MADILDTSDDPVLTPEEREALRKQTTQGGSAKPAPILNITPTGQATSRKAGDDGAGQLASEPPSQRPPGWRPFFEQLFTQLIAQGYSHESAFERADSAALYVLDNYGRLGIKS